LNYQSSDKSLIAKGFDFLVKFYPSIMNPIAFKAIQTLSLVKAIPMLSTIQAQGISAGLSPTLKTGLIALAGVIGLGGIVSGAMDSFHVFRGGR
jgi:hypothetical protein